MKFYIYLIGWSKLNLWYYGARVANKVSPEMDLSISTLNKICSSEKGYGIESYSKKHKFKVERLIS